MLSDGGVKDGARKSFRLNKKFSVHLLTKKVPPASQPTCTFRKMRPMLTKYCTTCDVWIKWNSSAVMLPAPWNFPTYFPSTNLPRNRELSGSPFCNQNVWKAKNSFSSTIPPISKDRVSMLVPYLLKLTFSHHYRNNCGKLMTFSTLSPFNHIITYHMPPGKSRRKNKW